MAKNPLVEMITKERSNIQKATKEVFEILEEYGFTFGEEFEREIEMIHEDLVVAVLNK